MSQEHRCRLPMFYIIEQLSSISMRLHVQLHQPSFTLGPAELCGRQVANIVIHQRVMELPQRDWRDCQARGFIHKHFDGWDALLQTSCERKKPFTCHSMGNSNELL